MTIVASDHKNYRLLVAIRYLNASEELFKGLKTQQKNNQFHFLVTVRSFIEYTRRGIWFLAWAKDKKLQQAEHLTFKEAGSPDLPTMDAMLNEALGFGRICPLMDTVPGVNEPFLHCLHALTHGNPISVRMVGIGLNKIFDTEGLLRKAEADMNIFQILVHRSAAGEPLHETWKALKQICSNPDDLRANVKIAAHKVKTQGGIKIEIVP
jgi:hypothetical protein